MDLALAIALPIAAASFLLSLLCIAYLILSNTTHTDDESTDLELGSNTDNTDLAAAKPDSVRRLKPAEINSLTSNITSSCPVIGEGGFSTVYLSSLRSSLVAVKVHNSSQSLHRAYRRELDILLSVKHPNIVRLLGYCDDRDQGILIFEYIPNGTLHDIIHNTISPAISWVHRTYILFRIAAALDYLHEGCELQIIHGDVKSSNILLDDVLGPKLCDFGSGRMGFSATVTRSADQMMGSLGYTDPHYLRTGLVSKKSDVYSFGVLILEVVTGAEAFDPDKEQLLTAAMRPVLTAEEFVDPRLEGEYDSGEVSTMVGIAARCIAETPVVRPSMAEIVKVMMEKVCIIAPKSKLDT